MVGIPERRGVILRAEERQREIHARAEGEAARDIDLVGGEPSVAISKVSAEPLE